MPLVRMPGRRPRECPSLRANVISSNPDDLNHRPALVTKLLLTIAVNILDRMPGAHGLSQERSVRYNPPHKGTTVLRAGQPLTRSSERSI